MAPSLSLRAEDWGLLLLLAALWGSSFMFFELGLTGIPPVTLVFWRVLLAGALLVLVLKQRAARLRAIWQLRYHMLYLGFFGVAAPFCIFAYSQQHINSSFAALANATMPMFTYLLAATIRLELFKSVRLLGFVCGVCGVAALLGSNAEPESRHWVLGGLLCSTAPIFYAISTVSVRRLSLKIDAITLATGMILAGAALCLPAMLLIDGAPALDVGAVAWLGAAGMALFGTAAAYHVFMHLIGKIGASNASLAVMLAPFMAIVLGVVFLGERLDANFAVAAVMIVAAFVFIDEGLRTALKKIFSG